jgi:hypothetical protein
METLKTEETHQKFREILVYYYLHNPKQLIEI